MKQICIYWASFKHILAKIHLVDKFLIIFMAILMIQSVYSLFVNQSVSADVDPIDVVIRTSMAAIFGYILSANFLRHTPSTAGNIESDKVTNLSLEERGDSVKNSIGYSASTIDTNDMEADNASLQEDVSEAATRSSRFQIIAAASIGLFCLAVLIILRNLSGSIFDTTVSKSTSAAATVTQFRDFVSGCIGFLIGSPTSAHNLK